MFHVFQLKKVVGNHLVEGSLQLGLEGSDAPSFLPENVIDTKYISRNEDSNLQLLIRWYGKPVDECTSMDHDEFAAQFPYFTILGNKVVLHGEGFVMQQQVRNSDARKGNALLMYQMKAKDHS